MMRFDWQKEGWKESAPETTDRVRGGADAIPSYRAWRQGQLMRAKQRQAEAEQDTLESRARARGR